VTYPKTLDQMAALPIDVAFPSRPVGATWFEQDQPMGYTDADGTHWRVSRYLDGGREWFRYRRAFP
jgi:hypothetical protein